MGGGRGKYTNHNQKRSQDIIGTHDDITRHHTSTVRQLNVCTVYCVRPVAAPSLVLLAPLTHSLLAPPANTRCHRLMRLIWQGAPDEVAWQGMRGARCTVHGACVRACVPRAYLGDAPRLSNWGEGKVCGGSDWGISGNLAAERAISLAKEVVLSSRNVASVPVGRRGRRKI